MEAAELTQVLSQQLSQVLGPIKERLTALEAQMKSAKPSSEPSPASSKVAQELHGLCDDQACEVCVGQTQELAENAFAQGKVAALEDLDQWLIQAGGEDFRQKIIQLAARGKEAWEQSQQEVRIVA